MAAGVILYAMTLYDIFVRFLRSKGCEVVFRENFYRYNYSTQFCRDIWDIMVGDEYFLNRAFCWAETAQGKPYWKDISEEWEQVYFEERKRLGNSTA